ncbi:MAG TPA: zf-TFIIB domain-containing protein [Polyangiaceae bacterium]|nr:zf-TFIIB domain-containing protein [Polyangiaceae bacterium]
MNDRCPKCGAGALKTIEGSIVLHCSKCSGFWVPPLAFGEPGIVERLKERDLHPDHPLEQDHRTGVCPDGHGVLRRARVSNDDPYFLERCARCGGVWFDPGEWSRLAEARLLADVTNLWSPAWRDHLSEEQNRAALRADLRSKLGAETFQLLEDLVDKLSEQNLSGLALAYLQQRLRDR